MRVSVANQLPPSCTSTWRRTLLFLIAVILGYARFEQLSRLVVFGENNDFRFIGLWSHTSAEHSATDAGLDSMAPSRYRIP